MLIAPVFRRIVALRLKCANAVFLLVLIVLAAGCSNLMNVQLIDYNAAPGRVWSPRQLPPYEESSLCGLEFVGTSTEIPDHYTPIGDAFVADNGWSVGCGKERVERDIEAELCRLDADYGLIWRLRDWVSSCYQARAIGYRCREDIGAEDGA